MKFGSICSGVGGAELAFRPLGWEAAWCAEIADFPSAVLAHRFPGLPNLGDFTKIGPDAGPIDLLIGGTPCFPAGTLIVTDAGLRDIAEVRVGDRVLTHEGRFRVVLAAGHRDGADTLEVRGQGGVVQTTAEHPFLAIQSKRRWDNPRRNWRREFSEPAWVPASELRGGFWASPTSFPTLPIPAVDVIGRESSIAQPDGFWWVVGAWLGDGWVRIGPRRGYVLLCAAHEQADEVAARLAAAGLSFNRSSMRSTVRFQVASRALARWLVTHFGKGAAGKRVPTWLLGAPERTRRAVLAGYLFADGCTVANGVRITTISKGLALGARLLFQSLGQSVSVVLTRPSRAECVIDGRRVRERPFYTVAAYDRARSSIEAGGKRWGLVRSVVPTGRRERVYNLEVEEDNSYVADGAVVHNCQSFSVAGKRAGLDDPRGHLTLEFLRLARRLLPRWVVWENVPGVLSDDGGRTFGTVLGLLGQLGYGFAYRVFDAQYFGLAQRRRRVFVVGYLGDWRPPAAVLFEPESLRGDPPTRREAGARVAATLASRAASGSSYAGRCQSDDDNVIAAPLTSLTGSGGFKLDDNDVAGNHVVAATLLSPGDGGGLRMDMTLVPRDTTLADPISSSEGRTYTHEGKGFRLHNVVPFDPTQLTHPENRSNPQPGDPAPTLPRDGHGVAVATTPILEPGRRSGRSTDDARCGLGVGAAGDPMFTLGAERPHGVGVGATVRRLTPRECEWLQGYPTDWTLVPYGPGGKLAKDGPRYRAIGNGFPRPVIQWIGERIAICDAIWQGERTK